MYGIFTMKTTWEANDIKMVLEPRSVREYFQTLAPIVCVIRHMALMVVEGIAQGGGHLDYN